MDYAMHEVLELLSLGRSRTNINPEVCIYYRFCSSNMSSSCTVLHISYPVMHVQYMYLVVLE